MSLPLIPDGGQVAKRKYSGDHATRLADSAPKKARVVNVDSHPAQPAAAQCLGAPLSLIPHSEPFSELRGKYEIKALSVLSSTSMNKRVDTILRHLGRFHPWDLSVLPGVVLLYAKSSSTNKLISIIETVRRRVHETDQKWYQYNRLFEQEIEVLFGPGDTSVVEDTAASPDEKGDDDGEEDDFEVMETTLFEKAVQPPSKVKSMAFMSVFLSRVPIPELAAKEYLTVQTNEEQIDFLRKRRNGLA